MHHILSTAIIGIDAEPVTVEADIAFGMPAFNVVGLPDTSVKEARDRIRAAIRHAGFSFPRTRVTVNLAPAHIRKQGSLFDLPIALAILLSDGVFPRESVTDAVVIGELSLDGSVRPASGALSAALLAKRKGLKVLFVPRENAQEAACVPGVSVLPAGHLKEVVEHLQGVAPIRACAYEPGVPEAHGGGGDFADIRGQQFAKRGLEIAAAGGHNVLFKGPPGTGKTLLARAIPSILPPLGREEALETTSIASVAGTLRPDEGLMATRPFRTPHHSCSAVSLVGGGAWPRPGEATLAHRGVLFLDELPEFSRHVLEHLRQPLEDGEVTIARAAATVRFPARFILAAAMNPCPCGYASDPARPCICTPRSLSAYQKKISGPLLDRFDLMIEVPNLESRKLLSDGKGEPSSEVRKRVEAARARQSERFDGCGLVTNGEIPQPKLDAWCALDAESKALLEKALDANELSARGFARVRKIARTIADLAGDEALRAVHVAEALQYRPKPVRFG